MFRENGTGVLSRRPSKAGGRVTVWDAQTLGSAITMSPDRGGIFDVLRGLVSRGLGGANGDGRQYVSWMPDLRRLILVVRQITDGR
jgi:NAD dependent epimerase/dehydratase family enzyme